MKLEFRLEQFGKVLVGKIWEEHMAQAWPPPPMPVEPYASPSDLAESIRRILPVPEGPDHDLNIFRRDLALALLACPSAYMRNVSSYRESKEFLGGSETSLVALLGGPSDVAEDATNPEKRARQVAALMQGVHVERVKAPWAYDSNMRVWGVVRDVAVLPGSEPAPGVK